ncbi:MAG: PTS sugar transporter subunit IIB [Deltaproteobacteria bacterium]|nr:PTS sugar transporter subunit IIB [Deltaproteobacteria bacterium]
MIILTRVDDRLVHGQLLGAWVPYVGAEMILVVSDKGSDKNFSSCVNSVCAEYGIRVALRSVAEAIEELKADAYKDVKTILVIRELSDAMKLFDAGFKFEKLNIGNIHHKHNGDGRELTRSVILNTEDDEIVEHLSDEGVEVEIRDLPSREPTPYYKRERSDSNE